MFPTDLSQMSCEQGEKDRPQDTTLRHTMLELDGLENVLSPINTFLVLDLR